MADNDATNEQTSDHQSWKEARHIVSLVGEPPRFLSAAVQFLLKDVRENNDQVSDLTMAFLKRLLSSPSFLSALYYATKVYHPETLKHQREVPAIDLVNAYSAKDISAFLSLLYLFRRISKGCNQEAFAPLAERVANRASVGGLLGLAIPRIGFSQGLLLASMPSLARGMFLGIDTKGYLKLESELEKGKVTDRLAEEYARWGCSSLQVGILLLQLLGAGAEIYERLVLGLAASELPDPKSSEDLYSAKLTEIWVVSLLETGKPPEMVHRGEYYPLANELASLLDSVQTLHRSPEDFRWLLKTKRSLSSGDAPELASASEPISGRSDDISEHLTQELEGEE